MERRMLSVFSAMSFAAEMRIGVFFPFFALYLKNEIKVPYGIIGRIIFFMIIINAIFQIVWGWASDRVGKRKHFLILGEGIPGVLFLFIYQIKDVLVLASVVIIVQIFWSMSAPAWKALIAEHSGPKERGSSMGMITAVGGVGSMLGVFVVGYLIYLYGYAFLFYVISSCLFFTSFVAAFIREPEGLQPVHQNPLSMEQIQALYKEHRPFSSFTILVLLNLFASSLISSFISLYADSLGGTVRQITSILIVKDGAATVFMTPMGMLTDRIGKVKMLEISLAVSAVAVLLYAVAPVWWVLIPVTIVEGVGWSGYHVSWFAVLSSLTPRQMRGMYMGFHYSIVNGLSSFGSIVGGDVADNYGLKNSFFVSFVMCTLTAALFVHWLRKNREKIDQSDN